MFEELLTRGGISLDRLRNFCEVAEKGGLAKAAEGDPARQSLYSRQIKELESFFGVELTTRKGKGLELTEAGRELARLGCAHLKALCDFSQSCAQRPISITFAAGNAVLEWVILPRMKKLRALLPLSVMELRNERNNEVYHGLTEGAFDFGILRRDVIHRPLKWESLGMMRYALYVPRAWLQKRPGTTKKIAKTDADWLSSLPLAITTGRQSMEAFDKLGRKHGITWNVALRSTTFTQASRALRSGEYAAVLPELFENDIEGDEIEKLDDPNLETLDRELCLAWNPRSLGVRPALESVVERLAKLLQIG